MKVTVRISSDELTADIRKQRLITWLFDKGLLAARTNPVLISSVKIPLGKTISTSIEISSSDYYYMRNQDLTARQVIQIGLDQLRHQAPPGPAAGPGHALDGFEP